MRNHAIARNRVICTLKTWNYFWADDITERRKVHFGSLLRGCHRYKEIPYIEIAEPIPGKQKL